MTDFHLIEPESVAGRLVAGAGGLWRDYTRHPFVEALARGELAQKRFRFYLVQDYLFLVHFARAWALAAFKAEDIATIRECAGTVHALIDEEMRLHIDYCAGFGLDEAAMAATPEHPANIAYTRFVMERGLSGDILDLLVALAPCVFGYGEIGARLPEDPTTLREANPYQGWIDTYSGADYRGVVASCSAQLDRVAKARLGAEPTTSPRWPGLQASFDQATRLEIGFWQMGWEAEA